MGYPWETGDKIIKERANGFLAMPDFVESGLDLSVNVADIDVAAGWAFVGANRVEVSSPVTVPIIDNNLNYIYLEITQVFVSGKLNSVTINGISAYSSPQTYVAPQYGILIGTVQKTGGSIVTDSIQETNRGVPINKGQDVSDNVYTVAPRGGDFESLERAIIDVPADSTLLLYEGANYILTQQMTISKNLNIIGMMPVDPRQWFNHFHAVNITVSSGVSMPLFTINSGVEVYFKSLDIKCDLGQMFDISGGCKVVFDHCSLRGTDVGAGVFMIDCQDSTFDFLESVLLPDGTDPCSGMYFSGTTFAHLREATIFTDGIGNIGVLTDCLDFRSLRSEIFALGPTNASVALQQDGGTCTVFFSVMWNNGSVNHAVQLNSGGFFSYKNTYTSAAGNPKIIQNPGHTFGTDNLSTFVNDGANIMNGIIQYLRNPSDDFEPIRLLDLKSHVKHDVSSYKTVGPSPYDDFNDFETAILLASDGDTLLCFPGATYNLPNPLTITKKLYIVAGNTYDPRDIETPIATFPLEISVSCSLGAPGNIFTIGAGGALYFKGFFFSVGAPPTSYFAELNDPDAMLVLDHSFIATGIGNGGVLGTLGKLKLYESRMYDDGPEGCINGIVLDLYMLESVVEAVGASSTAIVMADGDAEIHNSHIKGEIGYTRVGLGDDSFHNSHVEGTALVAYGLNFAGASAYFYSGTFQGTPDAVQIAAGTIYWGDAHMIQGGLSLLGGIVLPLRTELEDFEFERVGGVTRQVFHTVAEASGNIGAFPRKNIASGQTASMSDIAPWDFGSIAAIEIIVIPNNTNATFDYSVDIDFAADGQAYNANSNSSGTVNFNAVANQKQAIDITSLFAGLAAGDTYGVKITNQEGIDLLDVLGIRFRWKKK